MKSLTDSQRKELLLTLASKETTFISLTNEYLKTNKRVDRDRCLIMKGKIEHIKELLEMNAHSNFVKQAKKLGLQ